MTMLWFLLTTSSAFIISSPVRSNYRCRKQGQQRVLMERRGSKDYYEGMLKSGLSEEDSKKDMLTPTLKLAGGASAVLVGLLALFVVANADVPPAVSASTTTFEPRGITLVDGVVFLVGTVPFLWAANEFWRRIAVGDSFGTGSDSIVIDPEADGDQIRRFGGRRILGQDAIIAARLLMAIAAASVALTAIAAFQL